MCGAWIVPEKRKIGEIEVKNRFHRLVEFKLRQRPRRPRQLKLNLLQMVHVKVGIAKRVDEIAEFQARHLRHHHGQHRVARNVEGYT